LYTIARVNFLFDPSQEPHMRADELCAAVGVSKNTASAKSTQIMDMLDIYQLDPDWTRPSRMDDNLLAWMITIDGFVVDALRAASATAKSAANHAPEVHLERRECGSCP
jgi:hypothetical protein